LKSYKCWKYGSIYDSIFDMNVNAGRLIGILCLQRALNLINVILLKKDKLKELFEYLLEDGINGAKTIEAYKIIEKRHELTLLLKTINYYRAKYYEMCALNYSKRENGILTQKGFIRSWFRRI